MSCCMAWRGASSQQWANRVLRASVAAAMVLARSISDTGTAATHEAQIEIVTTQRTHGSTIIHTHSVHTLPHTTTHTSTTQHNAAHNSQVTQANNNYPCKRIRITRAKIISRTKPSTLEIIVIDPTTLLDLSKPPRFLSAACAGCFSGVSVVALRYLREENLH